MKDHLEKITQVLKEKHLDSILVSSPSNLIYLTGYPFEKDEREAFILVSKAKTYIIASPLIQSEIKKIAPEYIFLLPPFGAAIKEICQKENIKILGIESNNITLSEYKSIKTPQVKIIPLILETLRDVKDTDEIAKIEQACIIGDKAFSYILREIKPGMTEKEIAFLLESFIRKTGADISFKTIIAFGKNAAIPHHVTSDQRLKAKDIVLLDFGVNFNNYYSDMSRTIFIGKPTEEEKRAYETVRIAQEMVINVIANEVKQSQKRNKIATNSSSSRNDEIAISAKAVDKIARDYIFSQGYPEYPHSLGHSIGIDLHDGFRLSPSSKNILLEHMVFSIEPGIYLENNMGVRIEDIVVLEKSGPRLLTKSTREMVILPS